MKKNLSFTLLAAATVSIVFFTQCSKSEDSNTNLKIIMVDGPTALDEVNVDVQGFKINFREDSLGWINIPVTPRVYNLLALQNGVSAILGSATVSTAPVKEIRLILGTNNTVKENGVILPLTVPSGSESGLKIKVDKKLATSVDSLVIDFDAALSVKKETDGFKLKPVIKLKN
jgi:Domain of unknown function (DUF4382)